MREKIGKLARGITDIETPVVKIIPESVFYVLKPGIRESFYIEVNSVNGQAIKGIVLSDDLRVRPEKITFAGRRIHIQLNVSTVGLKPCSRIGCQIKLITNAGEFSVPCEFETEDSDEEKLKRPADIRKNPLSYASAGRSTHIDRHPSSVMSHDAGQESPGMSQDTYQDSSGMSHDADPYRYTGNASVTGDGGQVNDAYPDGDNGMPQDGNRGDGTAFDAEDEEALKGLLSELIDSKDVSPFAFQIYKKAIEKHINYTRLYESYVAAYPDDCDEEMPREVILYFSYDIEAAPDICEKLYANILTYQSPDSEIFEIFAPRMSAFAMNRAMSGRINKRLAIIYDRMIYSDMVDRKAAEILPDIFKCREIRLTDGEADFLTVVSDELNMVIKADIVDGIAYVPMYFDDSRLDFYRYDDEELNRPAETEDFLTQYNDDSRIPDAYGQEAGTSRGTETYQATGAGQKAGADPGTGTYRAMGAGQEAGADPGTGTYQPMEAGRAYSPMIAGAANVSGEVQYKSKALFDRQDILNRCFELYPEHPMLRTSACRQVVHKYRGTLSDMDRSVLVSALADDGISKKLRTGIIRTLCGAGGDLAWMRLVVEDDIDADTCPYIFDVFMAEGEILSAYSLIRKYGAEVAPPDVLADLCSKVISGSGDDAAQDEYLILLCKQLFDKEKIGDDELELLCSGYMGSISDMLKVFAEARARGVKMGRIPERLITFELFADVSAQIDEVFAAYVECCDYEDVVVRAYFQTRCSDYFLYEENVNRDILMGYLYSYIRAQDDPLELPVIFLIAMTSDFSGRESLDGDEAALCKLIANDLIERGLIFRYTKKLRKLIQIPEEICWKYYIEYRAEKGSNDAPKLLVKILPDEDEYHVEEMRRVYKNVYVMSTVLFIGDRLHYLIYPSHSAQTASEEGEISVVKLHRQGDDRMRYINLMMKAIEEKNMELLRDSMLNYAESVETVRLLFDPGTK